MSAAARPASRDESLFQRVARENGISAPRPVTCSHEEWDAYCRKVWAKFPAWAFDEGYLTEIAREFLPRILAQMNFAGMIGRVASHAYEIAGKRAPLATLPLDSADAGRYLLFRLPPGADGAVLLLLDEASHGWRCPDLARRGRNLIELGAWRWSCTEAKAAHRVARLCGLARPYP